MLILKQPVSIGFLLHSKEVNREKYPLFLTPSLIVWLDPCDFICRAKPNKPTNYQVLQTEV